MEFKPTGINKYLQDLKDRYNKTTAGQWSCYSGGGYVSVGSIEEGVQGHGPCGVVEKKQGSIFTDNCQAARDYEFIAESKRDITVLINILEYYNSGMLDCSFYHTAFKLLEDKYKAWKWLRHIIFNLTNNEFSIEYYQEEGEDDRGCLLCEEFMGVKVNKINIGPRAKPLPRV